MAAYDAFELGDKILEVRRVPAAVGPVPLRNTHVRWSSLTEPPTLNEPSPCSASFGDEVWPASNYGQGAARAQIPCAHSGKCLQHKHPPLPAVVYAIKTRSGNVYLKMKKNNGELPFRALLWLIYQCMAWGNGQLCTPQCSSKGFALPPQGT